MGTTVTKNSWYTTWHEPRPLEHDDTSAHRRGRDRPGDQVTSFERRFFRGSPPLVLVRHGAHFTVRRRHRTARLPARASPAATARADLADVSSPDGRGDRRCRLVRRACQWPGPASHSD